MDLEFSDEEERLRPAARDFLESECPMSLVREQMEDGEELRDRVKKELSAYKVPRHVFVYDDGTLPFTDTGKVDKRRLSALLRKRLHGAQAE